MADLLYRVDLFYHKLNLRPLIYTNRFSLDDRARVTDLRLSSIIFIRRKHKMISLKGKVVLITGASSGIGLACARSFATVGAKLLLGGRRMDRLETLTREIRKEYQGDILPIKMDVTKQRELEKTLSGLPQEWKEVEVLINNAGLSLRLDKLYDADVNDWDTMIDTNVKGLLYVTRLILPGMVERNKGHVINIGSIAGLGVYPGGSVYCASKAAVRILSDGMRMDLFGKAIRVTNIEPGMVKTEFSLVRWKGNQERAEKTYEGIDSLTPEDLAEVILFCATRPPHVNIGELVITPTEQVSLSMVKRKGQSSQQI
jgi:3-hydroxy acid dehydrogenase/malonic semialdehyde reductase